MPGCISHDLPQPIDPRTLTDCHPIPIIYIYMGVHVDVYIYQCICTTLHVWVICIYIHACICLVLRQHIHRRTLTNFLPTPIIFIYSKLICFSFVLTYFCIRIDEHIHFTTVYSHIMEIWNLVQVYLLSFSHFLPLNIQKSIYNE